MSTTWNDSRFGPGSYEHASQEDRSVPRVRVHIAATLRATGHRSFATIVRDVSRGGFTATASERIDARTLCWLTVPGCAAIEAEIVWWEAGLIGAAFASLLTESQLGALAAVPSP